MLETTLAARLLVAALTLFQTPWGEAEDEADRRSRLATIVDVIEEEAVAAPEFGWTAEQLAAVVLVQTGAESGNWRLDVHAGTRTGDSGRALCLGQLHVSRMLPRYEWARTVGTDRDSTERCIRGVVRYLASYSGCAGGRFDTESVARVLTGYATGNTCNADRWPESRARSARVLRVLGAM